MRRLRRRDAAAVAVAPRRGGGQAPGDAATERPTRWKRGSAGFVWAPARTAKRSRRVVLGKSPLAALLLTSMIEWFTQAHYVEHVRGGEGSWMGLFRDILKFHWIDEKRHARLDFVAHRGDRGPGSRTRTASRAVNKGLELGGAVDELLARQVDLDIQCLAARALGEPSPQRSTEGDPRRPTAGPTAGRSWCRGSSIPSSCASSAS